MGSRGMLPGVNLKRLFDGDTSENLVLRNGDTVFVPKVTSFFVLGEVQRQGAYSMEKDTTVLEAVTLAGGFSDRAASGNTFSVHIRMGGRRPWSSTSTR